MKLKVRVTTRASRNEIAGMTDGVLLVRLKSPPVNGKANAELIRLIAKALKVRQVDVEIVKGHSSRDKVLEIAADAEVPANFSA